VGLMFRKRYHIWRSLIYIVDMPSESLEDSITGDATAYPSSRYLEDHLQQLRDTKQKAKRARKYFLASTCLICLLQQGSFRPCAQRPKSVQKQKNGGGFWFSQTQGKTPYEDLYNYYPHISSDDPFIILLPRF